MCDIKGCEEKTVFVYWSSSSNLDNEKGICRKCWDEKTSGRLDLFKEFDFKPGQGRYRFAREFPLPSPPKHRTVNNEYKRI